MGDKIKMTALNWSDKFYTLSDLAEKLKLSNCLVKSTDQICTELDYFEVLCFKHIYCVRAFKVSTPADRDAKDDTKNNNTREHPLTSGEEVFIPLHHAGRGTIVPLYGESQVCKTVEELIMAFPRYVLIEEDLTICSDSKMIQLKAGSELELLRNTKNKHYQDKLICRYGAQTLQLSPSDIGRFRVRPDPNHYSVKDILQRLKLPQIIDFTELAQDQWEKEVNFFEGLAPEQNYVGKFLLTGLFKDKVAVAVSLGTDGRPVSQPFLLPLSSDLLQQLTFKFAFRGDFSQIDIKNGKESGLNTLKNQKKGTAKREAKLKRGKSEADISQGQQIPFELTYTQYRFPQAEKKGSNQGDNIFKKFSSAVKTVTGKFKKASSKDVAAIRNGVLKVSSPEPNRKASTRIYPILANLMNEESSIYDYIESGTLGRKNGLRKAQSQFYFEIEPQTIASAPTEECINDDPPSNEGVYEHLEYGLTEEPYNEVVAEVAEDYREGPIENEIETRLAVNRSESDVHETDDYEDHETYVNEVEPREKDDGDETEKDVGSFADSEDCEYMNYNKMATLQIRRRSTPGKRSALCIPDSFAHENVKRDSNWNVDPSSTLQKDSEEKSDLSTEEERSYTESGCSSLNTDLDDYELEVTYAVPEIKTPIPIKRKSTPSAEASDGMDSGSGSERSSTSDIGSDMNASASSGEQTSLLEAMSVMELCECLQQCGLIRISTMCKEHSLDGAFICALPNDSLQEPPFSLCPLEVMKLSMMKKGWKPKMR